MSIFRKFIYFCVQVDRDALEETDSSYERTLVYASFIRQILGALFVFAVFLYAWSILLPLWMAISISALLAAIVFFIDQAIIASQWMFYREFSRNWIYNMFGNFFFKLLGLLPRAVYAVVIAVFMATLAEITIQGRAIKRLLNENTREINREYFEKINTLKSEQSKEIERIDDRIKELVEAISMGSSPDIQQDIEALKTGMQSAKKIISDSRRQLEKLNAKQISLKEDVRQHRADVVTAEARVTNNGEQMRKEETPERCLAARYALAKNQDFDIEICRRSNWVRYRNAKLAAEKKLAELRPALLGKEAELNSITDDISSNQSRLDTANSDFNSRSGKLRTAETASSRSSELKTELREQEESREDTQTKHKEDLEKLEKTLDAGGYLEKADYGPLELYVGLKRLHHPPIPEGASDSERTQLELQGEAARKFSMGLWLVIILFELAPVLVAFFTPFSHVAMRMRKKRDDAERNDLIDRLQKDHDIQEQYAKTQDAKEAQVNKRVKELRLERNILDLETENQDKKNKLEDMKWVRQNYTELNTTEQSNTNLKGD